MLRHKARLFGLFLPIALVGFFALANVANAQKVRVEATGFTPPNLSLLAEPRVIQVCEGSGPAIVHLNARVTSNYPISYRWTSNAGRIEGDGATVTWDLAGLQPGYYRAYVDIDTGSGDAACQAFASTALPSGILKTRRSGSPRSTSPPSAQPCHGHLNMRFLTPPVLPAFRSSYWMIPSPAGFAATAGLVAALC